MERNTRKKGKRKRECRNKSRCEGTNKGKRKKKNAKELTEIKHASLIARKNCTIYFS